MAADPYSHPAWKRVRPIVLRRDRNLCQVRRNGCTVAATHVDHITPWRDGGAWFELDNLRASCAFCNISRGSHQKHHQGWRRSSTHIVLVWTDDELDQGENLETAAKPDDVVIGVARLAAAIANGDDVAAHHTAIARVMFDKFTRELRRGEIEAPTVWLVSSDDLADALPHHEIITTGGRGASQESSRKATRTKASGETKASRKDASKAGAKKARRRKASAVEAALWD